MNRRRGPLAGTHLRDSRMDDEMYTDWQAGESGGLTRLTLCWGGGRPLEGDGEKGKGGGEEGERGRREERGRGRGGAEGREV